MILCADVLEPKEDGKGCDASTEKSSGGTVVSPRGVDVLEFAGGVSTRGVSVITAFVIASLIAVAAAAVAAARRSPSAVVARCSPGAIEVEMEAATRAGTKEALSSAAPVDVSSMKELGCVRVTTSGTEHSTPDKKVWHASASFY